MEQEVTYRWIQERLRELRAGTITDDHRSRLEALAREDPFIADAMEGFQAHPDHPHDQYLETLAKRIRPYKRERRRWLIPNLTVTAVAASLILIVGFWAVMNRIYKSKENDFAKVESAHPLVIEGTGDTTVIYPDASAAAEKEITTATEEQPKAGESGRLDRTKPTGTAKPSQPLKEIPSSTGTVTDSELSTAEPVPTPPAAMSQPTEEIMTSRAAAKEDKIQPSKDEAFFANQMDPDLMARRVTGRVTNLLGTPLIGVNLMIRNTNLGTTSDLNGRFELYLPNPESTIDATYTGYDDATVILKQGDENVAITLPESQFVAGESKVLAKTMDTKKSGTEAASGAAPSGPGNSFIDYLKANSKYPLLENMQIPGHAVTVQFDINTDGLPVLAKVTQSSGENKLDNEAVRLIKNGPAWMCEDGKYPCRKEYTIYFRM